jgi:hypothetical protein
MVSVSESPDAKWANFEPLPPPEPGRAGVKILAFVVAIVVVAGAGWWLLGAGSSGADDGVAGDDRQETVSEVPPSVSAMVPDANRATVGDCVAIVKGGMDPELDLVECGTPEARYTVAHDVQMSEDCPDGPFVEYSVIGAGGWSLCLMLNAAVGECFKHSMDGPMLVDCAAADYRVTAVLPNTADATACPPQQARVVFGQPLVYSEPSLTICVDGIS